MATAEYARTDETAIAHVIGSPTNGVAVFCDKPGISLRITYQATGFTRAYPVAVSREGGLAAFENSTVSDTFKAGGTLNITAYGFNDGGTANIGVLEY